MKEIMNRICPWVHKRKKETPSKAVHDTLCVFVYVSLCLCADEYLCMVVFMVVF